MNLGKILQDALIIPVIVIEDGAAAVPLAQALVAGGLNVLEVTLRTSAALDAIGRIRTEIPNAIVGAGTVLNQKDVKESNDAGAQFLVSPGLTTNIARASQERGIPLLPGVATASEVMRGLDLGFSIFKFFPAETAGGPAALKALGGPFTRVKFCPTGGITLKSLPDYLSLQNVVAVGGSWMVPKDLVATSAFRQITDLAVEARTAAQDLKRRP